MALGLFFIGYANLVAGSFRPELPHDLPRRLERPALIWHSRIAILGIALLVAFSIFSLFLGWDARPGCCCPGLPYSDSVSVRCAAFYVADEKALCGSRVHAHCGAFHDVARVCCCGFGLWMARRRA